MEPIKSYSFDQSEIIQSILKFHAPEGIIDCDPTFSKGNFYKNTGIETPKLRFDINPQRDDVIQADCRHLPIEDNSLNCIMFDPPFLATSGKSLVEKKEGNNRMVERFGCYKNEKELHKFYKDSLQEFYRILKKDGILIFKCQDKIGSASKQYMSHVFIYNQAITQGFYAEDLFLLLAKSRLAADWQVINQKHARKFHCYFWVFKKTGKKIDFLSPEDIDGQEYPEENEWIEGV